MLPSSPKYIMISRILGLIPFYIAKLLFRKVNLVSLHGFEELNYIENNLDIAYHSFIIRHSTWERSFQRIIILLFDKNEDHPSYIIKVSSANNQHLKMEFESLTAIAKLNLKQNISAPIDFVETKKYSILIEKALKGNPLNILGSNLLSSSKRKKLYEDGLVFVTDYCKSLPVGPQIDDVLFNEYFIEPISFAKKNDFLNDFTKRIDKQALILESIKFDLRSTICHGDLWGGSILVDKKGNKSIIDWEFFRQEAVPIWDYFMYMIRPGFIFNPRKSSIKQEFENFLTYSNPVNFDLLKQLAVKFNIKYEYIDALFVSYLLYLGQKRGPIWYDLVVLYWESNFNWEMKEEMVEHS